MQTWWNDGVHEKSLRTYCCFARCNVPEHVSLVQERKRHNNNLKKLKGIPAKTEKIIAKVSEMVKATLLQ
jgi:hypothetical protein